MKSSKVQVTLHGGQFDGQRVKVNVLSYKPGKRISISLSLGKELAVYVADDKYEFHFVRTDTLST